MRRLAALLTLLLLAGPAFAHGGTYGDPPADPARPRRESLVQAEPGDANHRCPGLRGLAGEIPPDFGEPSDPPPPPPGRPEPPIPEGAAPLTVRVERGDGSPVREALVRLLPDTDVVPEAFGRLSRRFDWSSRFVDRDGRRTFRNVPPGRYRARVGILGPHTFMTEAKLVPGDDENVIRVPERFAPRERTVRVRLLAADGEPMSAYTVELRCGDGTVTWARGADGVVDATITGAGPLRVRAGLVGGCTPKAPPCACAHDIPDDAGEITLRIAPAPTTRTLVVTAPPDAPVGVLVRVVDRTRGTATGAVRVGPEGLHVESFEDALLDVVWSSSTAGRPSSVGDVLQGLAPGADVELPPQAAPTRTVSGRVVREDGSPVANARVRARSASDVREGALVIETTTGDDGTFLLEGIAGPVLLDAAAVGLSNDDRPVAADPGDRGMTVTVREERLP